MSGCARHAHPQSPTPPQSSQAPQAGSGCLPTHDGFLRARLRGASDLDIDWTDAQLQCDGGPRPDRSGIRVTFAGLTPRDHRRLRFVFGMAPGRAAGTSRGVPVNVTVIFEGQGRLYSTRGEDKCTIDELTESPIAGAAHERRVAGRGFCVAAAAAADGGEGLLLSRFDFAGRMSDE
ncbi:MAG TPA: hypothetical protein VIX87_04250 [Steroidobacteraceae bacterium]